MQSERMRFLSVSLVCAAVFSLVAFEQASGGIKCKGNFQVTKHGLISTPYCEEEQIARVARSYGMKVTAAEVRNNPNKKVYICQRFGGDNRLKGSCAGYSSGPGRWRY